MTVNIRNLRTAEPIPKTRLVELHTGSLLKRLELLRSLQNAFEESDWSPEEREAVEMAGLIAFKNTDLWKAAYSDLKTVLAQREHLPRGNKDRRRGAARRKSNKSSSR